MGVIGFLGKAAKAINASEEVFSTFVDWSAHTLQLVFPQKRPFAGKTAAISGSPLDFGSSRPPGFPAKGTVFWKFPRETAALKVAPVKSYRLIPVDLSLKNPGTVPGSVQRRPTISTP
jgi:hypothetical protein